MSRRGRELETLLLTMFAAVPLYFTAAIGKLPVLVFHAAMVGVVVRVAMRRGPDLLPASLMRALAIAYVPFYFVDWRLISGSAIAASTHLVLFIAFYQPVESMQRHNQAQRMLTTALIFVASLATSTHIAVLPFVIVFGLLMFRQLMYVSHLETVRVVGASYSEPPSGRAATFYLAGSMAIGAMLFPVLPRVRSPFMSGFASALPGGATSLSETIDFGATRGGTTDATIVARVWLDDAGRAAFTPLRLRGMVYDRYDVKRQAWAQTPRGIRDVPMQGSTLILGRAAGGKATAIVQQRAARGKLFLPVGAYSIDGHPGRLYEGPTRDTYYTYAEGALNLTVHLSGEVEPLRLSRVRPVNYEVTPEVAAMARRIVGNEQDPERQAELLEQYLVRNFRYIPNAETGAKPMSMEDFLLRRREGHCEYFAAGMVVLLTALDVPSRIAGGFYAGRLNPLTGYYAIRRTDAHAWTEVWNGRRWVTFDATPPSLRPGAEAGSLIREYASMLGDSLTFAWDRYVLTFGMGDQVTLAQDVIDWTREAAAATRERLTADLRNAQSPAFLAVLALLTAAGVAAVALSRRRGPLFDVVAKHLQELGVTVDPAMTVEDALRELRDRNPDAARKLEPLIALYEEERFSSHTDRSRAAQLRRRLRELRA